VSDKRMKISRRPKRLHAIGRGRSSLLHRRPAALSIVGNDALAPIAADIRRRLAAVVERAAAATTS